MIVEIAGEHLAFAQTSGQFSSTIEFWVVATDPRGRAVANDSGRATLRLNEARHRQARERGVRMVSKISLRPGRHRIRVAARESGANRGGSLFVDVDVPNFDEAAVNLSTLVLTSREEGRTPALDRNADLFRDSLPALPTATRRFAAGDEVAILLEAYGEALGPPGPTCIVYLSGIDTHVQSRVGGRVTGAGRGVYRCAANISLSDMKPGTYIVRVEVSGMSDDVMARETALSVHDQYH